MPYKCYICVKKRYPHKYKYKSKSIIINLIYYESKIFTSDITENI